MSISTRISCDYPGCTEERKQSNHWFLLKHMIGSFIILAFDTKKYASGNIILCGETHLSQYIASHAASLHAPKTDEKES